VTAPTRPRPNGAEYTRELLDRRGDIELEFVRSGRGRVHVIVPADPDTEPVIQPWSDRSIFDKADCMLGLARRITPTVCGFVATVYFDSSGNHRLVDIFDDLDLCGRCQDLLGPYAPRAFEHPRPGTETDEADD